MVPCQIQPQRSVGAAARDASLAQRRGVAHGKPPQRLSVIIPTRNEERQIDAVLQEVVQANVWEAIVVDGQSTDRTRDIARTYGVTVVVSQPGRGVQMNTGAAVATGDVLLFLHADTRLPHGYDEHVFRTLGRPGVIAGAFRLRIDSPERFFRFVEKLVDWRARILQMPYGDQAIFVTRETLHRVGGFPALPVMEDFELVRRLRRIGRVEIAPVPVVTSARRWRTHGMWRTTLVNQACLAAYHWGVSPQRIAAWRDSGGRLGLDPHGSASTVAKLEDLPASDR